jgi:alpha,alpha-trehalase
MCLWHLLTLVMFSFGWVNASYIYGLQIVNAHMRRALGTLTPYDTFIKAVEENRSKALAELV